MCAKSEEIDMRGGNFCSIKKKKAKIKKNNNINKLNF